MIQDRYAFPSISSSHLENGLNAKYCPFHDFRFGRLNGYNQWWTQEFSLGGVINDQVKKLNNKIGNFNSLSKGFVPAC